MHVHESIYQYVVVISVNSNVSVSFPICYLNLLHHFLAVMGRVIPNGQFVVVVRKVVYIIYCVGVPCSSVLGDWGKLHGPHGYPGWLL